MSPEYIEAYSAAVAAVSAAVAAGATVRLVVLTRRTLVVLEDYARDTKRIADLTSKQLENSQAPFVVFSFEMKGEPGGIVRNIYYLENGGVGSAFNVYGWYRFQGTDEQVPVSRLASIRLDQKVVLEESRSHLAAASLEYESINGQKYKTEINDSGDAKLIKIDPAKA